LERHRSAAAIIVCVGRDGANWALLLQLLDQSFSADRRIAQAPRAMREKRDRRH
jgi:hypothetical protein